MDAVISTGLRVLEAQGAGALFMVAMLFMGWRVIVWAAPRAERALNAHMEHMQKVDNLLTRFAERQDTIDKRTEDMHQTLGRTVETLEDAVRSVGQACRSVRCTKIDCPFIPPEGR